MVTCVVLLRAIPQDRFLALGLFTPDSATEVKLIGKLMLSQESEACGLKLPPWLISGRYVAVGSCISTYCTSGCYAKIGCCVACYVIIFVVIHYHPPGHTQNSTFHRERYRITNCCVLEPSAWWFRFSPLGTGWERFRSGRTPRQFYRKSSKLETLSRCRIAGTNENQNIKKGQIIGFLQETTVSNLSCNNPKSALAVLEIGNTRVSL